MKRKKLPDTSFAKSLISATCSIARFAIISLLVLAGNSKIISQPARDYLVKSFSSEQHTANFSKIADWRISQKKMIEEGVSNLPDSIKKIHISDANKALPYPWPALTADLYMNYKIKGNRSDYENLMYERRRILNQLVIGYLISHEKKYIPQIVSGLWAVLEESSWVWPAHLYLQKSSIGLPDPAENIIDLGAGETASNIACIGFVLSNELDEYSTLINKRIHGELEKRIFQPYLQRDDFWWMGFGKRAPNNWNPWVNTNVLYAALYTISNKATLNLLVNKITRSADKFINIYPEDGSCDEGYEYWGEAAGKLIRLLYLLDDASDIKINFSSLPLLHKMGTYITKVYIGNGYFINFADADKIIPRAESVYRYGQIFNDDTLKRFSAYLFKLTGRKLSTHLVDFIEMTKVYAEISELSAEPIIPAFNWFPDLQVLSARNKNGNEKGLFFAAQGGHNAESHNHNDVGNFILYVDGNPVIIDAGVGEYTSKTFSSERYTTWNLQSQWHNCPAINGVDQKDGRQFEATTVSFNNKGKSVVFQMDISKAYPDEAFVKKWERIFTFNALENELELKESYLLQEWKQASKSYFLTRCKVKKMNNGTLLFEDHNEKYLLQLKYNEKLFECNIERKEVADPVLQLNWGEAIYRVVFTSKSTSTKGQHIYSFSMPK